MPHHALLYLTLPYLTLLHQAAGFSLPTVDTDKVVVHYPDAWGSTFNAPSWRHSSWCRPDLLGLTLPAPGCATQSQRAAQAAQAALGGWGAAKVAEAAASHTPRWTLFHHLRAMGDSHAVLDRSARVRARGS